MVRLKRLQNIRWNAGGYRFQFHNGSIKAERSPGRDAGNTSFNSTMVRLKPERSPGRDAGNTSFNSTMVRLKKNFFAKLCDVEK